MPRFKDQAVCIRHIDWSETSQVVTLLTESHGKLRGVAKGSKRTSAGAVARFSGGIEILTCGEVLGISKATTDLANITEWDLQRPFFHLRRDLGAQRLALYAADLCNALLADDDPHPAIYSALVSLLDCVREPHAREEAVLRFQWTVLVDSGYRPQLDRDVRNNLPLEDQSTYLFDALAGGFTGNLGAAHVDGPRGPWRVRGETLQLLRRLDAMVKLDNRSPASTAASNEASNEAAADVDDGTADTATAGDAPAESLAAAPPQIVRANRLLCVYFRTILDRELPTMRFILGGSV